jgi:hypothetical protein
MYLNEYKRYILVYIKILLTMRNVAQWRVRIWNSTR